MLLPVTGFESVSGLGIQATVDGQVVLVGSEAYLTSAGIDTGSLMSQYSDLPTRGQTIVFVVIDNQLSGLIPIADPVRPTSSAAVSRMKELGLEVVMLTGDTVESAEAIANQVGIDRVTAGVLPDGKLESIRALQADGHVVAMVGDGINDGPALAEADIGLAMGSGTQVAIEAADATLLRANLNIVADTIKLGRRALQTIRQNLFFAFVYNILSIPVAAGVLYSMTGMLLSPMVASAAMTLSSLSVVLNSLRLQRIRL